MRHGVFGRKLGRDIKSRKALLRNLTNDLFLHGAVKTTTAKAKFVQSYAEKVITTAKRSKLGGKRVMASSLTTGALLKLTDEIAPGFDQRNGGYTRIIKLSPRTGDNASMAKIELLELDKSKTKIRLKTKKTPKSKTRTSQSQIPVKVNGQKQKKSGSKTGSVAKKKTVKK